jgi:site-specific recombinase XerD
MKLTHIPVKHQFEDHLGGFKLRFRFFLRKSASNSERKCPIVLRILYNKERRDLFTGLYCEVHEWDSAVPNLDRISEKTLRIIEELKYSDNPFTIAELIARLKGEGKKLNDYLESEKKKLKRRVGVDVRPSTYDKYKRIATHLQSFLQFEYGQMGYPIRRIDVGFLERYFQYLRTERKISHNTSVKYLTFLKTILMPAIRAGLLKDDPFKQLRLKRMPVATNYLSLEEISNLENVVLENPNLDRIRDIFLFCCYTGLSYIDLKYLSKEHILKDNEDSFFIRKPRQKTGQDSVIPLLPAVKRILQKYSKTDDIRDFQWQVLSNQKMNQRLKRIATLARVSKSLHMHLARHSFATTVTLCNGVPLESVSQMMGHSSLRQTQHYAKIVPLKLKTDMDKISELFK